MMWPNSWNNTQNIYNNRCSAHFFFNLKIIFSWMSNTENIKFDTHFIFEVDVIRENNFFSLSSFIFISAKPNQFKHYKIAFSLDRFFWERTSLDDKRQRVSLVLSVITIILKTYFSKNLKADKILSITLSLNMGESGFDVNQTVLLLYNRRMYRFTGSI